MGELHAIIRTVIVVNDIRFELATGTNLDNLTARIETAVRVGGGLVELTVTGERLVRVLITPATHLVISAEPVAADTRILDEHHLLPDVDAGFILGPGYDEFY